MNEEEAKQKQAEAEKIHANHILHCDLSEAGVRINNIIWLGGAISAAGHTPEFFSDFIEDLEDPEEVFEGTPICGSFEGLQDEIEFAGLLLRYQLFGFVIRAEIPSTFHGRSASWLSVEYKWIYAETIGDAVKRAVAWANEVRAEARK